MLKLLRLLLAYFGYSLIPSYKIDVMRAAIKNLEAEKQGQLRQELNKELVRRYAR